MADDAPTGQMLSAENAVTLIRTLATNARAAQQNLGQSDNKSRSTALVSAAMAIRKAEADIMAANRRDIARGKKAALTILRNSTTRLGLNWRDGQYPQD